MRTQRPRLSSANMTNVKRVANQEGTPRTTGGKWSRIRAAVLRDEPLCRLCHAAGRITAATQVDHIIPLHLGGTDERSNLQPICTCCHDEKSAAENAQRRETHYASSD